MAPATAAALTVSSETGQSRSLVSLKRRSAKPPMRLISTRTPTPTAAPTSASCGVGSPSPGS
jgi:hypothetical protein